VKRDPNPDRKAPSAARRRFLEAARKEFAAKGYAGASIRAITRSLNMRESAFYAHFKSKQEAYDELFREAGPPVMEVLAESVDPARSLQSELSRIANSAMKAWTSSDARASTSILLREAFSDDGRRQQMLDGVSEALDVLEKKFAYWQKQGRVSAGLDARTLAFQFVAPLIATRLLFYNAGASVAERAHGRRLVEKHVQNFLRLLSHSRSGRISSRKR
jgi:AcrR family transcriptional regulator